MKAMVLRAPNDVALEAVAEPKPGPNQVLVRVSHSGICGTDLKIYHGAIPVSYPRIMGHETVGVVVEGGDDRIRNGQRVIADPCLFCGVCHACRAGRTSLCPNGGLVGRDSNGGFAEYLIAPRSQLFPLPDAIDSQTAPLIQVLTTCLHGQRMLNIFPSQSVVVMGLGVGGQLHVQLAKARGAHPVIGITRSAWKRRLAEQLGADITLSGGPDAIQGVLDATGGRGADVVIESTGMVRSLSDAITMASLGGTLLLFGIVTASDGALPLYQLYFKEITIVNGRAAKGEDFPASIDLVARGAVKLEPLVTHTLPFTELESALQLVGSDAGDRMKIILQNN
jgi:2-desacetyl-2-hydroxyethyl bacteriochlorophyllide A dehydrogenase